MQHPFLEKYQILKTHRSRDSVLLRSSQAVFSDRVAAGVADAVAGDGALPAVAPAADQARGVVVAARQQLRVVVPVQRAGQQLLKLTKNYEKHYKIPKLCKKLQNNEKTSGVQ